MEDKNEKKVALNDELLDRVAGGLIKGEGYTCPLCGMPAIYGYHVCRDPHYEDEPIARA